MPVSVMLMVALAGGAGAVCRYSLDHAIARRTRGPLPWGTWWVNITGSLALGVLMGLAVHRGLSAEVVLVVGGGFLGAYTTFSTWMYQSVRLIEEGAWQAACLNLLGSVLVGGLAAGAGWGSVALWHGSMQM